jgi:hypothetical protein
LQDYDQRRELRPEKGTPETGVTFTDQKKVPDLAQWIARCARDQRSRKKPHYRPGAEGGYFNVMIGGIHGKSFLR